MIGHNSIHPNYRKSYCRLNAISVKFYLNFFLFMLVMATLGFSPGAFSQPINANVEFTNSNLPIILIDTYGQTIPNEYRIDAWMRVIYNGRGQRNNINDVPNNYDGHIAIELRGSATLAYPKKGYRFETQDAQGNNLNVSLVGMPKENDWVLYGPYDDQSLIRNVLAYRLSNDMGRYASRTRFCELVLNNDYQGLYVLMEKIKRDKNRINVTEMKTTDITGDAVTGGYMIKFDKEAGENVGGWWSAHAIFYQYHEPKADEIVAEQKTYIKNFMNQFETAMTRVQIADSATGYPHYIDVPSFVDHFILSEFCKNIDAYRISFYMSKDRDSKGGKLNAGPIWDFNLSFGKTWFKEDTYRVDEWEIDHNRYKPNDWPKVPYWWERLGHDPAFARQAASRWTELRQGILQLDSLYRRIDLLVDSLAEARTRNFQRWPETASAHSYATEILWLKQWIKDRIIWIEANFPKLTQVDSSESDVILGHFQLEQNYPNPFNLGTRLHYQVAVPSQVQLIVYDVLGRQVKILVAAWHSAGRFQANWDGTDAQGLPVPAGVYFCRFSADGFRDMIKMVRVN